MCFIFGTGLIFSFTLVAIALSASQAIAVSIKNTGGAGLFMFSKIILNGWDHNISDHGAKVWDVLFFFFFKSPEFGIL